MNDSLHIQTVDATRHDTGLSHLSFFNLDNEKSSNNVAYYKNIKSSNINH